MKQTVKELEQSLLLAKKTVERALDNFKKIELLLVEAKAEEVAEAVAKQIKAEASKAKAEEAKIMAAQKVEKVNRAIASYGKEAIEEPLQDQDPELGEEVTPEIPTEDSAVAGDVAQESSTIGSDETPKVLSLWDKIKEIGEKPFLEVIGMKKPVTF